MLIVGIQGHISITVLIVIVMVHFTMLISGRADLKRKSLAEDVGVIGVSIVVKKSTVGVRNI